jgi:hypothetical protein
VILRQIEEEALKEEECRRVAVTPRLPSIGMTETLMVAVVVLASRAVTAAAAAATLKRALQQSVTAALAQLSPGHARAVPM